MSFVDALIRNILSPSPYFITPHGNSLLYFLKVPAGNATLLYCVVCCIKSDYDRRIPSLDDSAFPAAVISERIYLIHPEKYLSHDEIASLTDSGHAITLEDAAMDCNRMIEETIFRKLYDSLPVNDMEPNYTIRMKARRSLLYHSEAYLNLPRCPYAVTAQDLADELTGTRSLTKDALALMEKDRDDWIAIKSEQAAVKQLVQNPGSFVSEWELRLADAIDNLRPDRIGCVTAAFAIAPARHRGGNTEIEIRLSPGTILDHLEFDEPFTAYDFENHKKGRELLDAYKTAGIREGDVRCGCIVKLTYNRRILYQKYEIQK